MTVRSVSLRFTLPAKTRGSFFRRFLYLLNASIRPTLFSILTLGIAFVQETMSENSPDSLKESIYNALHKWYSNLSSELILQVWI